MQHEAQRHKQIMLGFISSALVGLLRVVSAAFIELFSGDSTVRLQLRRSYQWVPHSRLERFRHESQAVVIERPIISISDSELPSTLTDRSKNGRPWFDVGQMTCFPICWMWLPSTQSAGEFLVGKKCATMCVCPLILYTKGARATRQEDEG